MRLYHIRPGEKFNRLTALKLDHIARHNRSYFLFLCDCGKEKIIMGSLVKSGNTKSCGCLSHEIKKTINLLPNNKGVINHLILQYKRHARDRKIDFNLDYETFSSLIKKPCYYCGLPPSNNKITKNCEGFLYSGIDRVNSSTGYEKDNCVSCCAVCNKAKMAMSRKDFAEWIKRAYIHLMAEQWGSL